MTSSRFLRLAATGFILWCGAAPTPGATPLTLAWDAPTQSLDGSLVTNLSGYRVYYGTAPGTYTTLLDTGPATTATLTNLQEGTPYYFAVSAYNEAGMEGNYSSELVWTPPLARPIDHFTWSLIASPQTAGAPMTVSLVAQDVSNATVSSFTGEALLSGLMATTTLLGKGSGSSIYPLATSSDDARTQVICLASELGQAGWLQALALDVKTIPGQVLNQWTLRLKHTPLRSYPSKPVWESSGWTVVYQGPLTISSTGLIYFTFSTQFYFNGVDNLMLDLSFNNSTHTFNGYSYYTATSAKRTLYYKANGTYGDPLTWSQTTPRPNLSASLPNLRFQFASYQTITPAKTTAFTLGVWQGTVTIPSPATSLLLSATDAAGHTGNSSAFMVLAASGTNLPASIEPTVPSTELTDDFDGDGMPDIQEGLAGMDAYDPESVLKLTGLTQTNALTSGYTVQWASVTGKTYRVMRSTNLLATPAFTPITSNTPGQESVTSYTDISATNLSTGFYQIEVEP